MPKPLLVAPLKSARQGPLQLFGLFREFVSTGIALSLEKPSAICAAQQIMGGENIERITQISAF